MLVPFCLLDATHGQGWNHIAEAAPQTQLFGATLGQWRNVAQREQPLGGGHMQEHIL